MFYVEFDAKLKSWMVFDKAGRWSLAFDSAVVRPAGRNFSSAGLVEIQAIHGLVIPPDIEPLIGAPVMHQLAPHHSRHRLTDAGRHVQLNPDGSVERYRA